MVDSRGTEPGREVDSIAVNAYNLVLAEEDVMPVLTIRNVPEEVRVCLRLRAARAGRSVEAEVRSILAGACMETQVKPAASLQEYVRQLYKGKMPRRVVDALIAGRRKESKRE